MRRINVDMELEYKEDEIEERTKGAGILPVCRDPINGEIYFLLGKERHIPHWKGSLRFSAFEGTRKKSETVIEAAVREFDEESMGVLSFLSSGSYTSHDLTKRLGEEKYVMRLCMQINKTIPPCFHILYVVEYPFIDYVEMEFYRIRNAINKAISMYSELTRIRLDVGNCFPFLERGTPYEGVGRVLSISDARIEDNIMTLTVAVENEMNESTENLNCNKYNKDEKSVVETIHSGTDSIEKDESKDIYTHESILPRRFEIKEIVAETEKWEMARSYCYAIRIRRALTVHLLSLHHPCITYCKDELGIVDTMFTNQDYLEKDELKCWSYSSLKNSLCSKSNHSGNCFRTYFLPVIQTVIENIS